MEFNGREDDRMANECPILTVFDIYVKVDLNCINREGYDIYLLCIIELSIAF